MEGRIEESMTSAMSIQLIQRNTRGVIYEGVGNHAAVEVAGAVSTIMI